METAARPRPDFGVYFLCNDAKLDWAYAFLASFREFNPTLPLTLIPFDGRVEKLRELGRTFSFDVLEDEGLGEFADLTRPISGTPDRLMHKMAAYRGPYERFLYLDTDIVVTADLAPLGRAFAASELDLVYFDWELEMVYRPGPLSEEMVNTYRTRAFITGIWLSRRGLFDIAGMEKLIKGEARRLEQGLAMTEQGLINYLCDKAQVRFGFFTELLPDFYHETWYKRIDPRRDGTCWRQASGPSAGKLLSFVHYAGQSRPDPAMPGYGIYLEYRRKFRGALRTACWDFYTHVYCWLRARKRQLQGQPGEPPSSLQPERTLPEIEP
jgi:hypothetical protein